MRAKIMNSDKKETAKNSGSAVPLAVDNEPTEEELDRSFDDILSRIWPSFIDWAATEEPASEFPIIHVTEHDQDIEVSAALPDVDVADLHVSISTQAITIRGIRRRKSLAQETLNPGWLGDEFKRTVPLPGRILFLPNHAGTERVTASLKAEVLTVILPKNKKCLSRPLEISE